ncbi:MAG: MATE family efflux transporter [Parasporobacterium sp.]|nr:MATE family efflux transporter [Parasporobacterium sp.]
MEKTSFFTRDRSFYKALFSMLLIISLQNLVAFSVNMADNIMLGSYSQNALSGAATVNQIFFVVQQFALSLGNSLVALSSQYWGQKRPGPIRTITGITLKVSAVIGVIFIVLCLAIPDGILSIFTTDEAIIAEGKAYLFIIVWTFLLFLLSNILMAALRAVGTVRISFYISIVSLIVNVGINYVLIFGKLGFPRLGIRGAAIGTLISRILEFVIIVLYIARVDDKLHLFSKGWLKHDPALFRDFIRIAVPTVGSSVLWSVSVPLQTAILGHLTADAIAANSVATTFYQYLKVVAQAMSATSAVMIGQAIGRGNIERVKSDGRTLSVICVALGVFLGALLFVLRNPLLSLYQASFTPSAMEIAGNLIIIMSFVMVGMAYQMPVCFGIIQGGGDAKWNMAVNMISTWCIVVPLSFAAAFWWKLPVEWVVLCVQSDQFFKGIPAFIHFRKYKWIKKLTRDAV